MGITGVSCLCGTFFMIRRVSSFPLPSQQKKEDRKVRDVNFGNTSRVPSATATC